MNMFICHRRETHTYKIIMIETRTGRDRVSPQRRIWQGCPQDVKSQDGDKTETVNLQDRDETETFQKTYRDHSVAV